MAPLECTTKELDKKYTDSVVKFVAQVRNGKLQGSNDIALATVDLLEQIISDSQNATAFELLSVVRSAGRELSRALPRAPAAGNMARRVLKAIRDEHRAHSHAQQSAGVAPGGAEGAGGGAAAGAGVGGAGESLQRLVQAAPARRHTLGTAQHHLQEPLREHIAELRLELESCTAAICALACEHVHSDELILTAGSSALVERFLLAATPRRYRLLVAETADSIHETHAMAARLAATGASVTVIAHTCVYAVMSRVNKVVMSAATALAGGAALAGAGGAAVALAASQHSVPVIVLAPLHKLSPSHSCDPRHFNSLVAPDVSYDSAAGGAAHALSPRHDHLPPDHVTLFITNLGGASPSYIYRLLSELYDPADYQL